MKLLTCETMKIAVLVSAVAFSMGVLFQIPALTSLFEARLLEVLLAFVGLLGMGLSISLALLVALMALFQKTSKRLKLCQH